MAYNNTYVALDKITVGSATPSVTLNSINQTYTDLILIVNGGTTSNGQFRIQVGNGSVDTGANYGGTQIYATSGGVGSGLEVNATNPYLCSTSSTNSSHIIQFMNYSSTATYKNWLTKGGDLGSSVYDSSIYSWRSTSAINTIKISADGSNTIASGTTFSLYGVVASGSNPTPKATGGTIGYTADGYTYHAFTSSGTFTPSTAITNAEYLVIAGGGAGGVNQGGGAGAGGYRCSVVGEASGRNTSAESQVSFANGTAYTVQVGAGGTGGYNSTPQTGASGTSSFISGSGFTTISTVGGGGGGAVTTAGGGNGGSGGGKGGGSTAGTGTANQGYDGGAYAGGGAGGTQIGQEGGAGLFSGITGVMTGRAGGSGYPGVTTYGAGRQNISQSVSNGVANTGSGGAPWDGTYNSGSGGSGIVIIRYPSA